MKTTTNRVAFHLRTGYLRTACGTHRAQTYVERARFESLPVEHRCVKCDAKLAAAKAREAAKAMSTYELHLVAVHPSHGDRHIDPVQPRLLGIYASEAEAREAGREFLASHPTAWVQTQDVDQRGPARDVEVEAV